MSPNDRLGDLRNAGNTTDQGASPWSEYRRLILAELERINSLAEGLRTESHRQQTQIVLLQDQLAQCARSIEAARERIEVVNRRLSEEPSRLPASLQTQLAELEKNYRSVRDRVAGIAVAFGATFTVITIAATVWNAWLR